MVRDGPMWDPTIWENIREAMHDVAERATACRHVLPRVMTEPGRTTITVDEFDVSTGRVAQNLTVPIVKFDAEFRLTGQQVEREDALGEGRSAAVALAARLAQSEEALLLYSEAQSDPRVPPVSLLANRWPPGTIVTLRDGAIPAGLLISGVLHTVDVVRPPATGGAPPPRYGELTVQGIEDAIAHLRVQDHYGPYAVVLSPAILADAKTPIPGTLVQPYELIARDIAEIRQSRVISPLFGPAPVDPPDPRVPAGSDVGLVVSVGGNSMDLVLPDDRYDVAFHQVDPNGQFVFRVMHRFALRKKREDAVVRLVFK